MLCLPVLCVSISLYRSRRNSRVEVSGSSKWLSVLVISRRAIHRHRHWRRSEVYSWPNCTVQAKIVANSEERSKDWVVWRGCGGGEVLFGGRGQGPSRQHPFASCTCTEDPHENHPSIVLGLPPPPTAIHLGPQATWMSLEAHPKPTVEGACGMLNAKTSCNLACGIGCYSP